MLNPYLFHTKKRFTLYRTRNTFPTTHLSNPPQFTLATLTTRSVPLHSHNLRTMQKLAQQNDKPTSSPINNPLLHAKTNTRTSQLTRSLSIAWQYFSITKRTPPYWTRSTGRINNHLSTTNRVRTFQVEPRNVRQLTVNVSSRRSRYKRVGEVVTYRSKHIPWSTLSASCTPSLVPVEVSVPESPSSYGKPRSRRWDCKKNEHDSDYSSSWVSYTLLFVHPMY